MNGLQTIVRTNNEACAAYAADQGNGEHLTRAPVDERFDHNIPWHFDHGTLHVHLHADTKVADTILLGALVASEFGPLFSTQVHRYS